MTDPDYGTDSDMPELMPELEAEPDESTNGPAMTLKSILEGGRFQFFLEKLKKKPEILARF